MINHSIASWQPWDKDRKVLKVKVESCSPIWLFVTPWTEACQVPLSVGFSRQDYWRVLPFPSLGDLPNPGTEPGSPALQTGALPSEPQGKCVVWFTVSSSSCAVPELQMRGSGGSYRSDSGCRAEKIKDLSPHSLVPRSRTPTKTVEGEV